ncbi:MAG TPA: type II toxin-antitoxin system RelE/ParE family toxin [Fimbriimonas sp.]|nr:type II toxin-antitoxin system RelE/ParE family toxin [Fimbriimonas sp.]
MTFKVIIMPAAMMDLDEYTEFISRDSKTHGKAWLAHMLDQMHSLYDMPERYPAVEEAFASGRNMRVINTSTHRIFFSVHHDARVVEVLRVWHTARRSLGTKTTYPSREYNLFHAQAKGAYPRKYHRDRLPIFCGNA